MNSGIKVLLAIAVFGAIIALIFAFTSAKTTPKNVNESFNQTTIDEETSVDAPLIGTLGWFFLLGMVIMIGVAIYFYTYKKPLLDIGKPISVEEAKIVLRQNLAKDYGVRYHYDRKGNFHLVDESAIHFMNQRPWKNPTGTAMMVLEVYLKEGKEPGLHTLMIPLNEGMDAIKSRNYAVDLNVGSNNFLEYRHKPKQLPTFSYKDNELQKISLLASAEPEHQARVASVMSAPTGVVQPVSDYVPEQESGVDAQKNIRRKRR